MGGRALGSYEQLFFCLVCVGAKPASGNKQSAQCVELRVVGRSVMGRYLLLWLLGVPIPILVLIWAFGGLH